MGPQTVDHTFDGAQLGGRQNDRDRPSGAVNARLESESVIFGPKLPNSRVRLFLPFALKGKRNRRTRVVHSLFSSNEVGPTDKWIQQLGAISIDWWASWSGK